MRLPPSKVSRIAGCVLKRTTKPTATRLDLEIEQQNSEVLASMNHRSNLQLRLQHTVEGLSVAAVSYYGSDLWATSRKGLRKAASISRRPVSR
ncbi:DUF3422 family protein [Agrobacterium rhizogenes]|uniref:DUF3422 family protein n=1 Tax=Rhizobium rhizogenes TaxID=359 RepID=UPI0022B68293|nr:DUF3422 family protein [Rhizobium rhizogenes]MCZ7450814.1 DUF3422 family protein [Rhizobium rhizogenes]